MRGPEGRWEPQVLVVGAIPDDQLAVIGLGPERLRLALNVVGDELVRDLQDRLGRAVVLLHDEDGGVGVVVLEVQEVLDGGAAPGVDALVGVADDTDVAVPGRQHVHQEILGAVRVLVLVDEDVAEPLLVVLQDFWMFAEEPDEPVEKTA